MTASDRTWTPLDLGVRFDARPYRLNVGVRRLDLDAWLLADDLRTDELRLKQDLLAAHHDTAVAALPSSEAAAGELLAFVSDAVRSAGLVVRDGDVLVDRASGIEVDPNAMHPIDAAGRLVQEDLCVMERSEGEWRLTAGSVCFPSRWSLAEKLGRSVREIHAPVPGYDRIERATDLAMDRVLSGGPMTRANWTLIRDPSLFQPANEVEHEEGASPEEADPPADAELSLRIERQTLRPLPSTGAIAFTIRTAVLPLESLTRLEREALAATLESVDSATIRYKGWASYLPDLRERLQSG